MSDREFLYKTITNFNKSARICIDNGGIIYATHSYYRNIDKIDTDYTVKCIFPDETDDSIIELFKSTYPSYHIVPRK